LDAYVGLLNPTVSFTPIDGEGKAEEVLATEEA
jgi:hypothetical protein